VRIKGFVQFRRRWQAIIRADFRLQNASITSCSVKVIASWEPLDSCHSWICWWKRLCKSLNCFANNADDGSIYCKLRETDSFTAPSMDVGRIFFQGEPPGIFPKFFLGGPKVEKFVFFSPETKKTKQLFC